MSQEDQRESRAKALLDYTESKQKVAMLRDKISEIGDFFKQVPLEDDPTKNSLDSFGRVSNV